MDRISPKYMLTLINKIKAELKLQYSLLEIRSYLERWIIEYTAFDQNFGIHLFDNGDLNLDETIKGIDDETLLKIAIDLGIETPDFIPCIPMFRNELKSSYKIASKTFELAFSKVEKEPDIAISLANAALESIIKEILKDNRLIDDNYNDKDTLYELTKKCLKKLELYPTNHMPNEIRKIGSGLLTSSQAIEDIRSDKTIVSHGKTDSDSIIDDPSAAYFVVNAVTTIGLFLLKQYQKKYPTVRQDDDDILPF